MNFPLAYSPPPQECYDFLVNLLHPENFRCPSGHSLVHSRIHRRHRMPVIDYQCSKCGKVFNVFTGTTLQGSKFSVTQIVKCFDGISREVPIIQLAKEMSVCRESLGKLRVKVKKLMPESKERRTAPEWSAIFREIECWEIEDCPEDQYEKRLVVKVKNGCCYALKRMEFVKIDPATQRKTKIKSTSVEWLKADYLNKK